MCESVAFSGRSHCKTSLTNGLLGQTKERDSWFPLERLLVLIKVDTYVGWENLMALNVMRLCSNKMWCVKWGTSVVFLKIGSNRACLDEN